MHGRVARKTVVVCLTTLGLSCQHFDTCGVWRPASGLFLTSFVVVSHCCSSQFFLGVVIRAYMSGGKRLSFPSRAGNIEPVPSWTHGATMFFLTTPESLDLARKPSLARSGLPNVIPESYHPL